MFLMFAYFSSYIVGFQSLIFTFRHIFIMALVVCGTGNVGAKGRELLAFQQRLEGKLTPGINPKLGVIRGEICASGMFGFAFRKIQPLVDGKAEEPGLRRLFEKSAWTEEDVAKAWELCKRVQEMLDEIVNDRIGMRPFFEIVLRNVADPDGFLLRCFAQDALGTGTTSTLFKAMYNGDTKASYNYARDNRDIIRVWLSAFSLAHLFYCKKHGLPFPWEENNQPAVCITPLHGIQLHNDFLSVASARIYTSGRPSDQVIMGSFGGNTLLTIQKLHALNGRLSDWRQVLYEVDGVTLHSGPFGAHVGLNRLAKLLSIAESFEEARETLKKLARESGVDLYAEVVWGIENMQLVARVSQISPIVRDADFEGEFQGMAFASSNVMGKGRRFFEEALILEANSSALRAKRLARMYNLIAGRRPFLLLAFETAYPETKDDDLNVPESVAPDAIVDCTDMMKTLSACNHYGQLARGGMWGTIEGNARATLYSAIGARKRGVLFEVDEQKQEGKVVVQ